jgi:hypothetical protein
LLSPVEPGADALMVAEPKSTPVTWAGLVGVSAPCAMNTLGVTVTREVLLLASATVTPPTGAGVANVTCMGTDCPGATVTPDCRKIAPSWRTSMAAEPLV